MSTILVNNLKPTSCPPNDKTKRASSNNLPWWSSSLLGALWWAERYAQRVRESQPLITTMTFSRVTWDKQEHHRMIFEDTFFTWDLGPNICWFVLNINHIVFRKIGVYFWGFLVRWAQVEHLLTLCILWPSLIFNFGYKLLLLVAGLSRIARGEVVSFCVPAVFWWILSYSAIVHVSFLLLCAVLCCFCIFICILCAFVISLRAHDILMTFAGMRH